MKTLISNALFGLLLAVFAIALLTMCPPSVGQAQELAAPTVDTMTPEAPPAAEVGNPQPAASASEDEVLDKLLNKWTLYSAGLINLLTYLTGFIPLAFFKEDRKRDLLVKTLAAVAVAAVCMVTLGPGDVWPVLPGFALAVFNYNNVLKPIVGSTKSKARAKAPAA